MEKEKSKSRFRRLSPYDKANFLSRFCFAYLMPLFIRGIRKNGLEWDDLPRCSVEDEAQQVSRRLMANWRHDQATKKRPNFGWTLVRTYGHLYILPFTVFIFEELGLAIAQPLLLSRLIRYFSGDQTVSYLDATLSGLGVCVCNIVFVLFDHPTLLVLLRNGMRLRTACCSLMYQKALRLSRASVGQTQVGQIINIMSNDMSRMDDFSINSIYFFIAPLQSAVIIYIVYRYLGVACFAGLALLLLYIPFQALMGKLFASVRLGIANLTDTRLRYMNEIISGIRIIKFYCWESSMAARVAQARKKEVAKIRKSSYLKAINLATFFVASRFILFVCFTFYVTVLGKSLTSEAVFVCMAMFNTLRLNMTLLFPNAVTNLAELKVTCKRIEKFLLLEEITKKKKDTLLPEASLTLPNELDKKQQRQQPSTEQPPVIKVEKITARWNADDKLPTLKDISVDLQPGDLLAVVGSVGSGKSSFLMSLLEEIPLEAGQVQLTGRLSYASQDTWTYQDSVRNNILFGQEYDAAVYQKVVEVCALKRDLAIMPFGDRTLVGEKGVSLSGGQRARINLARAVYRDADILLLDDPLSAVDAPVAKHIFERCILEYLSAKIRVLVTHQVQFIEKATKILVLKEGQCLAYGTYQQITEQGIDFDSLLKKNDEKDEKESEQVGKVRTLSEQCSELTAEGADEEEEEEIEKKEAAKLQRLSSTESKQLLKGIDDTSDEAVAVEEETHQRGAVRGRIYWEYIRAGTGPFLLPFFLVVMVVSQSLYHGSDIFLTYWTNQNQLAGVNLENNARDIAIYSALIGSMFLFAILRSMSFFVICTRASVRLHNGIFRRLLRTPVSFFDRNPAGRILNRFSADTGCLDEKIPYVAHDFTLILSQAVGVIVTLAIANWLLLFPAAVLVTLIIVLRQLYLKTARDIKRYEAMTRSPVYSHVTTTINGLASIRAYGAQADFERAFTAYQNDQTSTWFLFIASSRMVGYVMDLCCALFIFAITLVVLFSDMAGGTAGLIISSGLMLAGSTQYGVRMSAEFESLMTNVERIVEYKKLQQEAPAESAAKPLKDWPSKGRIEFEHMRLAYEESQQPVLKDITCTIEGGEKIGIVGRTGAGKSSMIAALFRLTEPTGAIRIDGVDIQSIGLDDLRQKISIIPQEPIIFSGTVRYNLDPFNEHEDCDLWAALEAAHLKSQVENFTGKLEAKLSDSGSNLSNGERQLICLARAILRRNQIIVADEATSSVDFETDNLIQHTIRTEFAANTVLTIAHRINTIIDFDRVLVLDAGQIVEFDRPYALLKQRGAFYEMCQKTGPAMYTHLHQLAREAYQRKIKDDGGGGA